MINNVNKKLRNIILNYFHNSISYIVIINIVLAIVAVLRDVLLATYMGTSAQADALLLAFFLPDTIGNNIIALSIGIACVPVFSKLYVKGYYQRYGKCVISIALSFILFSLVLTILSYIYSDNIIEIFGKGLSQQTKALSEELFLIMVPVIIFYPLVTIGSSVLQVFNRFNIPAFCPVIFNTIFLIGITLGFVFNLSFDLGVFLIASSITIGVVTMAVIIWVTILKDYKAEFLSLAKNKIGSVKEDMSDVIEVSKNFIPYVLIVVAIQSVLYIERYLASQLETGSIAGLNYAFRLSQFPIWVFVAAVGTVMLPALSKFKGIGDDAKLQDNLLKSFWLILLITIPLAICINILRFPIVTILLQRGNFDENSLLITTGILSGYSIAIIGQGIIYIGIRVFLALGKTFLPLLMMIVYALLNIYLDFFFVAKFGSSGLGYGAAVGSTIIGLVVLFYFLRYVKMSKKTFVMPAKLLVINLLLVFLCVMLNKLWFVFFVNQAFVYHVMYVFLTIIPIFLVYGMGLLRLKLINMDYYEEGY